MVECSSSHLLVGAGTLVLCVAGILTFLTAIECVSVDTKVGVPSSWLFSLIYGAVLWFWWAGVALLTWQAGSRWPALMRISAKNVVAQLAFSAAISGLHLLALHITTRLMGRLWPEASGYAEMKFFEAWRFGIDVLLYGLIWAACAVISIQITAQRSALKTMELKEQLSAAHLRALQMQLEPHFLFNTLNAITTLVEFGQGKEALETLCHLNKILKTTVKRSIPEKVPLAQELELVQNYLAIEQIRFADRLRVEMRVDPTALDGLVPCFLLQPIVENAIRHGIADCEADGVIHTSIERSGDRLFLSVRDNGLGIRGRAKSGHGVGLKNIQDRLSHFYKQEYDLRIAAPKTGGFEVTITIPYETAQI